MFYTCSTVTIKHCHLTKKERMASLLFFSTPSPQLHSSPLMTHSPHHARVRRVCCRPIRPDPRRTTDARARETTRRPQQDAPRERRDRGKQRPPRLAGDEAAPDDGAASRPRPARGRSRPARGTRRAGDEAVRGTRPRGDLAALGTRPHGPRFLVPRGGESRPAQGTRPRDGRGRAGDKAARATRPRPAWRTVSRRFPPARRTGRGRARDGACGRQGRAGAGDESAGGTRPRGPRGCGGTRPCGARGLVPRGRRSRPARGTRPHEVPRGGTRPRGGQGRTGHDASPRAQDGVAAMSSDAGDETRPRGGQGARGTRPRG